MNEIQDTEKFVRLCLLHILVLTKRDSFPKVNRRTKPWIKENSNTIGLPRQRAESKSVMKPNNMMVSLKELYFMPFTYVRCSLFTRIYKGTAKLMQ